VKKKNVLRHEERRDRRLGEFVFRDLLLDFLDFLLDRLSGFSLLDGLFLEECLNDLE
jgi:hypothetical protein